MNFETGEKSRFKYPITEAQNSPKGYGSSVNRTSIALIVPLVSELKKCLRNVLSLTVATFETRRKALSFIAYLFMVKATRRNKEDGKSG